MEIKAILHFASAYEYVAFLNMQGLSDLRVESVYPDLRTLEVVFEGCDDE